MKKRLLTVLTTCLAVTSMSFTFVYAETDSETAITLDGIAMGQTTELTTTASYVYEGGELDEAHSTMNGVTTDGKTTYISIAEDNVNGIVIRNTGSFVLDDSTNAYARISEERPQEVVLSDYVLELSGSGSNDMGGFGAAVYVSDDAAATLENFRIITRGAARGTLFSRFSGLITVNDSTLYAVSDPETSAMQGCPPGLFIEGSVRATNAVGGSEVTYNRSTVVSAGWGALSTDSDDLYTVEGEPTTLNVNDSYIAVLTSGYGAYSDGEAEDTFVNSAVDVPNYAAVQTGTGLVSFENCVINSGMYGVMTHSGSSRGQIIFTDTDLHVGESAVMLRDTANTVVFERSTLAFDGTYEIDTDLAAAYGADIADIDAQFGTTEGVDESYQVTNFQSDERNCIVKLIHNSDSGSGTESTGAAPTVSIIDSTMAGDILNTAAMTGDEHTATSGPAGDGIRTPRSLDVTLDGSQITGTISLGSDIWAVTHFASGANASQDIGYAESTELGAFHEDGYGLSLAVTNGSTWIVTEDSYLTSLVIDETSTIEGSDGASVELLIDGIETDMAAGTYEGEIVIDIQ